MAVFCIFYNKKEVMWRKLPTCVADLNIFNFYFQKITVAECIETQSKAMTMLTIEQLSYLLKFALQKMKQPGVRAMCKYLILPYFIYSQQIFSYISLQAPYYHFAICNVQWYNTDSSSSSWGKNTPSVETLRKKGSNHSNQ